MKLSALALTALFVLPAHQAAAQGHHGTHVEIKDVDGHDIARPGPRHSARDAHLAISTTNDAASLILTRDVVAMQLTDRTLRNMHAEMDRDAENDHDGIFASMVASVVRGTVGNVLRRSLEVPIRDIRTVDYRGGRLLFVTEEGERLFDKAEINGTDLTASFSPRDAQAFVREFRALKARTR
jgi:hypothetical protein